MMVGDMGGGGREHFHSINVGEPEEALPPISSVGSRSASWRDTLVGQNASNSFNLLESAPHNLMQIKSDPENYSGLGLSSNSSGSLVPLSGSCLSVTDAADDAQVKGQLLQEITRVAETFEPYNPSSLTSCYRNYNLSSDAQSHTDYIFADVPQWCWGRSPTHDKSLGANSSGSLFSSRGPSPNTVINSLQYNVPSHLMSDAFTSPIPTVSTTHSPTSIPSTSPIQRPPLPPLPPTLSSSALDLSPGPPSTAHQLPSLQPSLMTPATTHVTLGSAPPSVHQLPTLQPSLMPLDVSSQTFSPHDTLEDTLGLVRVEAPETQERMPDLECGKCGDTFTRLSHLKYHMKVHAEDVETVCDKQTDSKQDSGNSPFKAQSQEVFPCKQCDEKFSRAEKLKTHELKHSGDRPFSCSECGTTFSVKAMLIRHKKVHTGEKPYKCDICKTCFTESGSLKVHKRLHSGEKPFKCDQCEVAFNGAGMLATHKRKHTGERPYMCDECGETFRLLSTLKSHRRRHTGEKPFVCELCGSSFTQRAAMQRHKRIHSDQKPYECEECGYKFREKENLRKHITLHKIKMQHMCNICGAGFNQAKKLETHKMLHNGGERPYQCNKCPSTFTNPKYLTQHKKRVHDRKSAIKCEECNGTFKRKETLRSHMKIHLGESPYVCEECGAAFKQRGTLTKHIRVHDSQVLSNKESKKCGTKSCDQKHVDTGDQLSHKKKEKTPYDCSFCKHNFSSQKELLQHVKSSHSSHKSLQGTLVSEPEVDDSSEHIPDKYICEDCDQTFFRRRQLKAHKKYCLCRCPSYQTESPERVSTTTVHNDAKEVDAMKLLTAVLAVTGNNPYEVSSFQHSPSNNEHPSSVSTAESLSSSSLSVATNTENHPDHHVSFRLFSGNDPSYTEHLHAHLKDDHLDLSAHVPLSPQSHHSLLHQVSQDHPPLEPLHLTLQHLPHDQAQYSSHIHPSDQESSHILLSQSFEHHHSDRLSTHPHQQHQPSHAADTPLMVHQETQDTSQHPSRSHSDLQQEMPRQERLQLIQRQYIQLPDPLREHGDNATLFRHQDPPDQSIKLQDMTSKESHLSESSHEINPSHHGLQKHNLTQLHHHNHHMDLIVPGQFYKDPPVLVSSQHLPHHLHLPPSDHSTHPHDPPHPALLPHIKDCDDLAPTLQHQHLQDTQDCHCHLNDHHDNHLSHHFHENEGLNENDIHMHHHHQQDDDFCPTLEGPSNIKIENIIS